MEGNERPPKRSGVTESRDVHWHVSGTQRKQGHVTKLLCCTCYNQTLCCGKAVFQQLSVEVCLINGFWWNLQHSSAKIQCIECHMGEISCLGGDLRFLSAFASYQYNPFLVMFITFIWHCLLASPPKFSQLFLVSLPSYPENFIKLRWEVFE